MRPTNMDPTAGETARAIRLDPGATQRIDDPTDPRYGDRSRMHAGEAPQVFDPTDPVCEGPSPNA